MRLNEGIPADHNLTTYEAALLYGPAYGDFRKSFNFTAKYLDWFYMLFTPLSDVTLKYGANQSFTALKATDWKNVSAKKSNLTKVVFRDGLLENVDFRDSILTDVVFEDVTLEEVRFVNTTLVNVRFIHCTLNGVNIDQTKNSRIEVSRSRVINTSLSDGQLIASFKNSILTRQTSLTDLSPPSSLTFEKSELEEVNLSRSVLKELVLDSIKSKESGFETGTICNVTIRGDNISFGFPATKIDTLTVRDLNDVGLALPGAVVKKITIQNCQAISSLNIFEATIGSVEITNCPLNKFHLEIRPLIPCISKMALFQVVI